MNMTIGIKRKKDKKHLFLLCNLTNLREARSGMDGERKAMLRRRKEVNERGRGKGERERTHDHA